MEQYVFYYQINWDRKRPKHLTSLGSGLEYLSVTQIPLNCIHSSLSIPDKQGNYIDMEEKVKTLLLLTLRVKCSATKVFLAEIKFGSFSFDLIESGQYNEREPGVGQWEACVIESDQSEGTLSIDHCPAQWSMECFISVGQLLSDPDWKDKGIVFLLRTRELIK